MRGVWDIGTMLKVSSWQRVAMHVEMMKLKLRRHVAHAQNLFSVVS